MAASRCLLISGSSAISGVTTKRREPVSDFPLGGGHGDLFKQFCKIVAPRLEMLGSGTTVEPTKVRPFVLRHRSRSLESKV